MKKYLLPASDLSAAEINEIEGYLAQQGIHVSIVNHLGFSNPIAIVDRRWEEHTFCFRIRAVFNKPLPETLLAVIEQRLQSDSKVVRNGMAYRVILDKPYSGAAAQMIGEGIIARVMYTVGFLGTYPYKGER